MSSKESSKTDAMRAAREQAWEDQQKAAKRRPPRVDDTAVGSLNNEPSTPRLPEKERPAKLEKARGALATSGKRAPAAAASSSSGEAEARCAGCGKIRAIRNGKISAHQKGLGKPCPGAGKPA